MGTPIAIVGYAARLPGGATLAEIDEFLVSGRSAVTTWDRESLLASGVEESELDDGTYVPRSACVDWTPTSDPFGRPYSAHERDVTDPQHLLFLELAGQALAAAGIRPAEAAGREIACIGGIGMGLYAGERLDSYFSRVLVRNHERLAVTVPPEVLIGNASDHAIGRVAHRLGLVGPCVNVQTACSTSFASIDYAVQLLRSGRVELALAGAVSMFFPERRGYRWTRGSILSEDGVCRAFDVAADGTVGGSGGAVFALKRLDAVGEGETVHAVIEGVAVGNDGAQRVSYTAPSYEGQARVIRAALRDAGASVDEVDYVECHGTGTPVGDLVELTVLNDVFAGRREPLAVGSVKPALGHLDAAAGAAALVNVLLGMRRGAMPGTLHFERLEDAVAGGVVRVSSKAVALPSGPTRALVGVSSFGASGTSTHLLVRAGSTSMPADLTSAAARPEVVVPAAPTGAARRPEAPETRDEVLRALLQLVRERSSVEEISDDQLAAMGLVDLGLDSVDVVAVSALAWTRWGVRLDVFDLLVLPDVVTIAQAVVEARDEADR